MNKKIIKYLIWIIMISAILILMTTNQTMASISDVLNNGQGNISYSQFKTSKNIYCLNKGNPFASSEHFTLQSFSVEGFKGITSNDVDETVLKYIISEANRTDSIYGNRTNVGNYIPQIAVWKLAGTSLTSADADNLIANGYAYKNFPSNVIPTIEKNGTDGFAIKYYESTSSTNWGKGTYTNLLIDTISVTGATYSKTEPVGNGWYKRIYTKNSGATQATVSFDYETSRTANLKIFKVTPGTKKIIYLTRTLSDYSIETEFLRIGDTYYHNGCNGYQEPCSSITIDGIEQTTYIPYDYDGVYTALLEDYEEIGYKFYRCDNHHHPILGVSESGGILGFELKIGIPDEMYGPFLPNTKYIYFTSYSLRGAVGLDTYDPQNLLYGDGSVSTSNKNETIKFIQPVTLSFNKKDFDGNTVSGATLNVTAVENVDSLSSSSITIGSGSITVMPANGNSGTFKIRLSESAPAGYTGISDTTLTVSYNNGAVTGITSSNTTYVPNSSNKNITIKNKPKVNLIINKTDTLTGAKLANVRFKIELTNVESIEGYQIAQVGTGETQNPPTVVYVKTDSKGQIKLTGMVPTGGKEGTITVKITEVEVPTASGYYYKVLENPITVTMTYNNGAWTETGVGSISGNTLTVGIENQPYIKLSGNVWEDGQTGEKGNVSDANGQKDASEINLEGIIVQLYSVKDSKVIRTTKTDASGNYNFIDIPKTNEGYKIIFKYNGITYVETPTGTISKPTEVNRTTFNNRFKTISAGKSNDNTALGYTYNSGNKTSALNSTIDGHTTGSTDAKFQMSAQTSTYLNTATNVSCGLVKKNFDLAIGTDVKSAKLEINGKTTTYNYAQIMNGELNANFQNNSSTAQDVIYNLYLYSSDYNYRIADYKTDVSGENKNTILNNISPTDKLVNNFDELKELEAFVTYSVILKAQTTQNATVNEFVYYYDAAYTPHNIVSTDKYNVSIDEANRKITFTSKNNGFKLTSPNYRVEVELTFKINKDANGNITTKTATNIAEITKYSTDEGGLIDKDSAPGNANITFTNGTPKVGQYEDDTDEAKGLNIVLRTDETRTITGTVIEDTDKDGVLEDTESKVNGVVVQLIEIKKIGGQYYEYIWQETETGSNVISTTAKNGYQGTTYRYLKATQDKVAGTREYITEDGEKILNIYVEEENLNKGGQYKFVDFIPGNYIIRYIYGDVPRSADKTSAREYNGQDYKSTIDVGYNKAWYNTSNYSNGQSIARDNEARRLEVMSHSTTINTDLYEKEQEIMDSKGEDWKYHYTWMCAETSKINIPVDADNKATETNSTTASYNYTKNNTKVLFGNMNFGLALRPQENIVLEKHITALKITPSGTGVQSIVDAKALDIEKIVNGTEVEVQGITTGLATIKSTAANRGFWQVATDVEELMQGAELEVEYTYVLRNDSEEDYLTSFLIEEYEKGISNGSYVALLKTKAAEVKAATKGQTQKYGSYLGQFYYTGTKGANDALVSARVELFEEALNNDFTFDEAEATSFKVTEQATNKKVYGVNKADGTKDIEIDTIIQNKTVSNFLIPKLGANHTTETADWSRTIKLKTTLATVSGGELGANLPSYIAEILQYSNAAGRIDMNAKVANLGYVHSDDTSMTMVSDNEQDEFWAESIIITKPTGEDKLTPLQIVIITISATAILGVGIALIKKFVLKK